MKTKGFYHRATLFFFGGHERAFLSTDLLEDKKVTKLVRGFKSMNDMLFYIITREK